MPATTASDYRTSRSRSRAPLEFGPYVDFDDDYNYEDIVECSHYYDHHYADHYYYSAQDSLQQLLIFVLVVFGFLCFLCFYIASE